MLPTPLAFELTMLPTVTVPVDTVKLPADALPVTVNDVSVPTDVMLP